MLIFLFPNTQTTLSHTKVILAVNFQVCPSSLLGLFLSLRLEFLPFLQINPSKTKKNHMEKHIIKNRKFFRHCYKFSKHFQYSQYRVLRMVGTLNASSILSNLAESSGSFIRISSEFIKMLSILAQVLCTSNHVVIT